MLLEQQQKNFFLLLLIAESNLNWGLRKFETKN